MATGVSSTVDDRLWCCRSVLWGTAASAEPSMVDSRSLANVVATDKALHEQNMLTATILMMNPRIRPGRSFLLAPWLRCLEQLLLGPRRGAELEEAIMCWLLRIGSMKSMVFGAGCQAEWKFQESPPKLGWWCWWLQGRGSDRPRWFTDLCACCSPV